MTLTINLPAEVETKLRLRAAAKGRDAADYAREIIEREVAEPKANGATAESNPSTRAAIEDFLQRVSRLEPDPNRPSLTGIEAEIEQGLAEQELRKRGRT